MYVVYAGDTPIAKVELESAGKNHINLINGLLELFLLEILQRTLQKLK